MSVTYILGATLLLWLVFDLFSGRAWLHQEFDRCHQPLPYWGTMLLWLLVALSCFYWEI